MRPQKQHNKHRMFEDPEKPKGGTRLAITFTLICLGLAAIWPGALSYVLGDDEPNLYLIKISAILIAALFILVLLFTKIPTLTGSIPGRVIVFGLFITFLLSLGAGVASPQIQALQEDAPPPTFTPHLAQLRTKLHGYAVQAPLQTLEAQKNTDTLVKSTQKTNRYLQQLAIGDAYLEKKQYDLAIAAYEKARQISPTGIKAITNRAEAARLKSQYGLELKNSNITIEINPDNSKGYLSRGQAHMSHGQHDLAIADFNRVIELAPKDAQAFESRAHSHFKKGQYDQAIADFSRAIQLESSPGQ